MLTRIWPLPDDLPHAAGIGNAAAVARWFDAPASPSWDRSRTTTRHDPQFPRRPGWGPATTQQVLDIALAWAVLNRHFEIASFLLERGANINTNWATHEPASILHEARSRERGRCEVPHRSRRRPEEGGLPLSIQRRRMGAVRVPRPADGGLAGRGRGVPKPGEFVTLDTEGDAEVEVPNKCDNVSPTVFNYFRRHETLMV